MASISFDEYVDRLSLMSANVGTYKTQVAATAGDLTDIPKDLANALYIRDYSNVVDGDKKTVFGMKGAFFNGEGGDPISTFPVFTAGTWPNTPVVPGALGRFNEWCRRFKVGPGYTDEIGIALGIVAKGDPLDPGSVKSTIEVDPAQTGGYLATVIARNKGQADQFEVFARVVGTTDWVSLGRFTKRSADVTWPHGDGKAVMLDFRVQLLKGDEPYGQISDTVSATLNP